MLNIFVRLKITTICQLLQQFGNLFKLYHIWLKLCIKFGFYYNKDNKWIFQRSLTFCYIKKNCTFKFKEYFVTIWKYFCNLKFFQTLFMRYYKTIISNNKLKKYKHTLVRFPFDIYKTRSILAKVCLYFLKLNNSYYFLALFEKNI